MRLFSSQPASSQPMTIRSRGNTLSVMVGTMGSMGKLSGSDGSKLCRLVTDVDLVVLKSRHYSAYGRVRRQSSSPVAGPGLAFPAHPQALSVPQLPAKFDFPWKIPLMARQVQGRSHVGGTGGMFGAIADHPFDHDRDDISGWTQLRWTAVGLCTLP